MTCEHNWRYSDGKNGSAPYTDDSGRHVVDLHCSKCKKQGVEIYTLEEFEEYESE